MSCNLLGNAFKYTPQSGQVTFSAKENNGNLEVSIQDGEEDEEDSALELEIVRSIVEQHGGQISVESKPVGMNPTLVTLEPKGLVEWTKKTPQWLTGAQDD